MRFMVAVVQFFWMAKQGEQAILCESSWLVIASNAPRVAFVNEAINKAIYLDDFDLDRKHLRSYKTNPLPRNIRHEFTFRIRRYSCDNDVWRRI